MNIAVCIDYDNLERTQKSGGILNVMSRILQSATNTTRTIGKCDVRLYGGWYEEQNMTPSAQTLSTEIQSDFPAIIRVPISATEECKIRTTVQLAFSLLEEPSHHLFSTYRRKGRPNNIRVESPNDVGCNAPSCVLPMAKKLLKTGKCSQLGCTSTSDTLVFRHEQKIVDTMLSCDLIYLCKQNYDLIIIVSSDDDFLPPIRTAILQGAKIIRFHPKAKTTRDEIRVAGMKLTEMEI